MPTAIFGHPPGDMAVNLTIESDFTAWCDYKVNGVLTDWPAETALTLKFANGEAWEASIVGSRATFEKDYTAVPSVPNGTGAKVLYVNGTTNRVFFVGMTNVHG